MVFGNPKPTSNNTDLCQSPCGCPHIFVHVWAKTGFIQFVLVFFAHECLLPCGEGQQVYTLQEV